MSRFKYAEVFLPIKKLPGHNPWWSFLCTKEKNPDAKDIEPLMKLVGMVEWGCAQNSHYQETAQKL
jgi:hypothetical protein